MLFAFLSTNSQSFLKKKEKKAYECGYVHKESFLNKLKPMKLISKATGALLKAKPKSDVKKRALVNSSASSLITKSDLLFTTNPPPCSTRGDIPRTIYKEKMVLSTDNSEPFVSKPQNIKMALIFPTHLAPFYNLTKLTTKLPCLS